MLPQNPNAVDIGTISVDGMDGNGTIQMDGTIIYQGGDNNTFHDNQFDTMVSSGTMVQTGTLVSKSEIPTPEPSFMRYMRQGDEGQDLDGGIDGLETERVDIEESVTLDVGGIDVGSASEAKVSCVNTKHHLSPLPAHL
jgi:hypothetical protein